MQIFIYPMILKSCNVVQFALHVCNMATVSFASSSLENQDIWIYTLRWLNVKGHVSRGTRHSPLACSSLMASDISLTLFRNSFDETLLLNILLLAFGSRCLSMAKNSNNSHGASIFITLICPISLRLWSVKGLATVSWDGRVGGESGDIVVQTGHTRTPEYSDSGWPITFLFGSRFGLISPRVGANVPLISAPSLVQVILYAICPVLQEHRSGPKHIIVHIPTSISLAKPSPTTLTSCQHPFGPSAHALSSC